MIIKLLNILIAIKSQVTCWFCVEISTRAVAFRTVIKIIKCVGYSFSRMCLSFVTFDSMRSPATEQLHGRLLYPVAHVRFLRGQRSDASRLWGLLLGLLRPRQITFKSFDIRRAAIETRVNPTLVDFSWKVSNRRVWTKYPTQLYKHTLYVCFFVMHEAFDPRSQVCSERI